MNNGIIRNRLAFYAFRELKTRRKAFLSIYATITICLFVLLNMFLLSYGSNAALIKRASEDYHLRIPYLAEEDIRAIQRLDYIKSIRSVYRDDGFIAYIHLEDPDPLLLKSSCERIIKDLSLETRPDFEKHTRYKIHGVPDYWINEQYYQLSVTPHYLKILPTLCLIFLLSLFAIFFSLRIKILRSQKEYGTMLTLGIAPTEIVFLSVLQALFLSVCSAVSALAVSIPLLKVVSVFTENAYYDSYPGVSFAVPWMSVFVIVALYLAVIAVFGFVQAKALLNHEIDELMRERDMIRIPYVKRSSDRMLDADKIKAYRVVYERRSILNRLMTLTKTVSLFALPMILLLLSISYNEGRSFTDNRDFWLSPGDGDLTQSILSSIERSPYVDSVASGDLTKDGGYTFAEIYSVSGFEKECGDYLEDLSVKYGLLFVNVYHDKLTLKAQADFFTPYFLIQSVLMFICGLIVIAEDLRYELFTRRTEFAAIRAIGYTAEQIRVLLVPYAIWGITGFFSAFGIVFLIMGLLFSVWITGLAAYPFMIVIGFGTLDYFAHRIICEKYIASGQKGEIAYVLAGRE